MTGPSRTFRMTGHVMGVLRRILDFHAHVEGLENLVDRPTLFVVNHFTRMETFIVPYLLYQHTGREAHSLAHAGLFKGVLGEYLKQMGTVSVREPLRNRRIIGELLVGVHDWVIFPEGLMVKSKEVIQHGTYTITAPHRSGPPHTGAAVLALKTELARQRYLLSRDQGDQDTLRQIRDRYGILSGSEPRSEATVVVPVNITFYPIRPHANAISRVATRIKHDLPDRVIEELRTEGSLLLDNTDMSIYLGKPIEVADYIRSFASSFSKWIPTLSDSTQDNFVVWTQKGPLTRAFMDRIYTSTAINIDHLVCLALVHLQTERISIQDFSRAILLSALAVRETRYRRTHPSLQSRLINIVADERHAAFDDIMTLAKNEGVVRQDGEMYVINRNRLDAPHNFHDIRLHNVVRVIANEAMPMQEVVRTVTRYIGKPSARLRKEVSRRLRHEDVGEFDRDYEAFYEESFSKAPSVGRPFILRNPDKRIGVLRRVTRCMAHD
jgi:1-acyl-sn-glycerol-3-phosphate acyltransferase